MGVILGVIIGLLILVFLVVAHELGHAVIARRNGVVVKEFGIGMPPRAWKKKLKNGVLLTLNWLPLGGFVSLKGEYDAADKPGDYGAATFWQKTRILFAGVVANWIVAAVLLSILAVTGLPKVLSDQFTVAGDTTIVNQPVMIAGLTSGHAAEKAGIKTGDTIIRFAGQEVLTVDRMIELSQQNKGKTIDVIYNRAGVEHNIKVALGDSSEGGYFGASLGQRDLIKATWSAPIVGVATTAQFTWLTLTSLGDMVSNLASGLVLQLNPDSSVRQQASADLKSVGDGVSGPVGILGTIFPAAQQAGLTQLVFLTAIISLSLAVMNVLPIPALDGGRWFTIVAFKLFKKKLTKKREEKIQTIGFSILMGLTLLVTIVDVSKLF